MITPLRWQREELAIEHSVELAPADVQAAIHALFETGQIPPRGFNGEYRLDIRVWDGTVKISERIYRVLVVRDHVTLVGPVRLV